MLAAPVEMTAKGKGARDGLRALHSENAPTEPASESGRYNGDGEKRRSLGCARDDLDAIREGTG